jgi:hypothetical protein
MTVRSHADPTFARLPAARRDRLVAVMAVHACGVWVAMRAEIPALRASGAARS